MNESCAMHSGRRGFLQAAGTVSAGLTLGVLPRALRAAELRKALGLKP